MNSLIKVSLASCLLMSDVSANLSYESEPFQKKASTGGFDQINKVFFGSVVSGILYSKFHNGWSFAPLVVSLLWVGYDYFSSSPVQISSSFKSRVKNLRHDGFSNSDIAELLDLPVSIIALIK